MWFEFLHQKLINKKRDFECTLLVIVNIFHIIVKLVAWKNRATSFVFINRVIYILVPDF